MMVLYDYWRSSAAWRVRLALSLKDAAYQSVPIDILPGRDEQKSPDYRSINPQMRVPSISVDGRVCGQSMAIIEWIDETLPGPALLPADPWERLRVRAFADIIACDVHPLNNLSPLAWLRAELGVPEEEVKRWYAEWIRRGFCALEQMAGEFSPAPFISGTRPGLAEITLIPQIANARRFDMCLDDFPLLVGIDRACQELEAFRRVAPRKPEN